MTWVSLGGEGEEDREGKTSPYGKTKIMHWPHKYGKRLSFPAGTEGRQGADRRATIQLKGRKLRRRALFQEAVAGQKPSQDHSSDPVNPKKGRSRLGTRTQKSLKGGESGLHGQPNGDEKGGNQKQEAQTLEKNMFGVKNHQKGASKTHKIFNEIREGKKRGKREGLLAYGKYKRGGGKRVLQKKSLRTRRNLEVHP